MPLQTSPQRKSPDRTSATAQATDRRRFGPKPKPIVEHPEPLFDSWEEPTTFRESLVLHMRRHGDSCWHLWKAVVRKRDRFDRRTIESWVSGDDVPRTAQSMAILGRVERRYRLPAGHFRSLLPHPGRATSRARPDGFSPAEGRRLAWHLPDDFTSRAPAERDEILRWVRTNVLAGTTEYRRFQAEAMKKRYALKFGPLDAPRRASLEAPPGLREEMAGLVEFKTATLTSRGYRRNGTWCDETAAQRVEHLGLMFGALSTPTGGPVGGLGVPADKLTLALLAFPSTWDW